jgi:hypothetical protein
MALILGVALAAAPAFGDEPLVGFSPGSGTFSLVDRGTAVPLWVDAQDWAGVRRAAGDLQADVARVSGVRPVVETVGPRPAARAVIIGTIGHSELIDGLVRSGKLDAGAIRGRWESYLFEVIAEPMPGVEQALVIAGSDRRGTIYGIYELSEQIGVSPWYWWADVPVPHHPGLYVNPGRQVNPGPAVKYRGIFLNDEEPALDGWVREKFGGFNHEFYERLFELLLRLKANYLWPAMWHSAFNEDDPLNPQLADEYGIVMGTSHHEPMLRAQQEWKRHGQGPWNYATNGAELRAFWTEGIRRNRDYESIITLGMRGDGDLPMSEEGNVALLEQIVTDQRRILAENLEPDVTQIPQLWALYKEVQEYYEKGMRVPDDVTLLWCDDNWGNLRRLPTPEERARTGGAGIYYHLDYVGGPRSYKWLNTVPITALWEQMHLAWRYGADRIWIVNVGDLKLLEFPTEFFLRYAWAPERWPGERLADYTRQWAAREFGPEHAGEIAALVETYTKFNGRRKPELLGPDTYSLVNYHEAETVVADYNALAARAERVYAALPPEARDAFFELVLYPVKACAIVNELYVTAGLNWLYAVQGRASTNALAGRARALFQADAELARRYNDELAGGKWRHMADQTHLGYTYWQQPVRNALPAITELQIPAPPELGVAVEGGTAAWPTDNPNQQAPVLPALDVYDGASRYIEVFNRGLTPFPFTAETSAPWLHVTPAGGEVATDVRLSVSADWSNAPLGTQPATVTIRGPGGRPVVVTVPVVNPAVPRPAELNGFVETNGGVSIEAGHYTRAVSKGDIRWQTLADFGRTLSGVTPMPVTAARQPWAPDSPRLEYRLYLFSAGEMTVHLDVAPTLDFMPGRALSCAVSFDDEPPQVVELRTADTPGDWEHAVEDAVRELTVRCRVAQLGYHVLKFWMVDPAVVLEKIVVDTPSTSPAPTGGARPSYLGPPESPRGPIAP